MVVDLYENLDPLKQFRYSLYYQFFVLSNCNSTKQQSVAVLTSETLWVVDNVSITIMSVVLCAKKCYSYIQQHNTRVHVAPIQATASIISTQPMTLNNIFNF